jgi:glycosyl transferase family 25
MYAYSFVLLLLIVVSIVLQTKRCIIHEHFNTESKQISAYVINLDRNTERYKLFMENYNNIMPENGIERISAVEGNSLSYKELEDVVSSEVLNGIRHIDSTGQRLSDKQLTRGMIGCYLSHIKIYEMNVNHSDIVLVFEDDAKFDININDFIKNLKELPDNWDIILLGTVQKFSYSIYSDSFYNVYEFWGTQGYIINNSGMKKMLQYYKPINVQIDFKMGELCKNKILNVYAYKDNIVYQSSQYSDVQMQVKQ